MVAAPEVPAKGNETSGVEEEAAALPSKVSAPLTELVKGLTCPCPQAARPGGEQSDAPS